jgi:hypothetical protein
MQFTQISGGGTSESIAKKGFNLPNLGTNSTHSCPSRRSASTVSRTARLHAGDALMKRSVMSQSAAARKKCLSATINHMSKVYKTEVANIPEV